jgi:hypothetical protein
MYKAPCFKTVVGNSKEHFDSSGRKRAWFASTFYALFDYKSQGTERYSRHLLQLLKVYKKLKENHGSRIFVPQQRSNKKKMVSNSNVQPRHFPS